MKVRGFAPIADRRARILILGSMPGAESLRRRQCYAHPHNRFWPLMAELLGFDAAASYAQKKRALLRHRVALWDVLKHCERPGSLDADIRNEIANDFVGFFRRHPHVHTVFFNGAKAASSFRRWAVPSLGERRPHCVRLPFTSPANAGIPVAKKKRAWRAIRRALAD